MSRVKCFGILMVWFGVIPAGAAEAVRHDWPQWQGPARDNISRETGLLASWPAGGPPRMWLYDQAGNGYSGPAIVEGNLYVMGTRHDREVVLALDARTGQERWATPIDAVYRNNWGDGPRATPTVDEDRVYVLSGQGTLACLNRNNGQILWSRTMESLGGRRPGWGYCESVLIDGPYVVCTPGGRRGTIACLDKKTGEPVWQSHEIQDGAQYASIRILEAFGQKQYVQLTMEHLFGVRASDGKLLWQVEFPGRTAVIPTPVVHPQQPAVFVTAGYGAGCKMVTLSQPDSATVVYDNKNMKNHHGGVVLVGDYLYGYSDNVGWVCMEFATGELVWNEKRALGKGSLTCADGKLYCLSEDRGEVVLVDASPEGWHEHGRFQLAPQSNIRSRQGRIWTHPVVADGKLYLRDQEYIYCYDIRSGQ
ncbi:MAG: polyvinyl alcohol dehydrogenase [Pirellulaceae bacterium]|nr:MAG: polyvinyl alcohol dehydrogenase [Pirellulaceae bacterium]